MKKLLLIAISATLFCGCTKITIKKNEIANTYWYGVSYYGEYSKSGERKAFEGIYSEEDGHESLIWHFGPRMTMRQYHKLVSGRSPYFKDYTYDTDLNIGILRTRNNDGVVIVYSICRFTDNELIVEYITKVNGDPNGLLGFRFKRWQPTEGFFDKYSQYEEAPEDFIPTN